MNTPLLAIAGPTGSGKSSLAIILANEFNGEIISCDSLQVYRHFDIGTAKLPEHEWSGIPHHLIDVACATNGFTAGDYSRLARIAIAEVAARGKLPIVAGGTGFYLRALIDGLSPGPPRDEGLRKRLEQRERSRPGVLHRLLRRQDPPAAMGIHKNDMPKLIRAIELYQFGRQPFSAQPPRDALQGYRVSKLGLFPPREELYARLDRRATAMWDLGLLEEVRRILASGVPRDAKPLAALGYKEALAVLEGGVTLDHALEQMRRDTRRYAKRQITWFRHEPGLVPLHGFGDDPLVVSEARAHTERLLNL